MKRQSIIQQLQVLTKVRCDLVNVSTGLEIATHRVTKLVKQSEEVKDVDRQRVATQKVENRWHAETLPPDVFDLFGEREGIVIPDQSWCRKT